jgi:riboflavin kinase/FMN adenylyltransferase
LQIIRGSHNIRSKHRGCVATIGNFDGVHLGHREILRRLHTLAARENLPSLLISFEPYPFEFFKPEQSPPRLTNLRAKCALLQQTDLNRLLILRFNKSLASLPAEQFVYDILLGKLGIRTLIVGDDFRFGNRRQGDFALLERMGREHGFDVIQAPTFSLDDQRVSSTRIRDALLKNDIVFANRLLGSAYQFCGRVVYGDRRGTAIGFPTANIHLKKTNVPLRGVYAVTAKLENGDTVRGVANVGTRPTVDGQRLSLEVHLFDFNAPIYGQRLSISFHHFVRGEQKFAGLDALKAQIAADCDTARALLRN